MYKRISQKNISATILAMTILLGDTCKGECTAWKGRYRNKGLL